MSCHDFLKARATTGRLASDDLVKIAGPLLREVAEAHEAGQVAPLEGLDELEVEILHPELDSTLGSLWFEQARRQQPRTSDLFQAIEQRAFAALDIVAESRHVDDVGDGSVEITDLRIGRASDKITRPVYLQGYRTWEHVVGHHDALTDIFSLGMILAGLAFALDFDQLDDLQRFVDEHHNLLTLAPQLHPVLARLIGQMTELDRRHRAQDLARLAHQFERYREVEVENEFDVNEIAGFHQRDRSGKRQAVLAHLEERLFEINRRNPLLHFRPRLNTLNLTLASVPIYVPESIQVSDLLTWSPSLHDKIVAGKPIPLASVLRFFEATYLPTTLDKIRAEARRDEKELGFSNLRLVAAFLRWHNVKEQAEQRIDSPLILLPVKLIRKKGIRDQYLLEPLSSEAEVNPVLRYQLQQVYGIRLPERVDLTTTDLDRFYDFLKEQIQASEPGVELHKVERPRIQMIHQQAKRRLDQFLRRMRRYGRARSYRDIDYSYRRHDFKPLGLQLFQTRVEPSVAGFESILRSQSIRQPLQSQAAPSAEPKMVSEERQTAAFFEGGETHAYSWELDFTRVTLGNFRYRKMSLVRDYDALLEDETTNDVFDALFSVAPRETQEASAPLALAERYPILPADPTQASAVDLARQGSSYIIQGPPGTGKSQTIANLVADFVAQGKRVLFVCQKRAALDVVYLRLKSLGLDELSCLVHDAQVDKKSVLMDMKRTYERFLAAPQSDKKDLRDTCLQDLDRHLAPLDAFDDAMRQTTEKSGRPLWQLFGRLCELRQELAGEEPELTDLDRESLPPYRLWTESGERLTRLGGLIGEICADGILANHPLAVLNPRLADHPRPLETVTDGLKRLLKHHERLLTVLDRLPLAPEHRCSIAQVRQLVDYAAQVEPFAHRRLVGLLTPASSLASRFTSDVRNYEKKKAAFHKALEPTKPWRQKLPKDEVETALAQAQALSGSLLSVFKPAWWRLRKVLNETYDWSAHQVLPDWVTVLRRLEAEYQAADDLEELGGDLAASYTWEGEFQDLRKRVETLRDATSHLPPAAAELHKGILASAETEEHLAELPQLADALGELKALLTELFAAPDSLDFNDLAERCQKMDGALGELSDVLPCLVETHELPSELAQEIVMRRWNLTRLEAALAASSLAAAYREDRQLAAFNGRVRDRHLESLGTHVEEFHRANVAFLHRLARGAFRERLGRAQQADANHSVDEKAFKKRYNKGRHELEHEFGKQMRYKSIRDLFSGPAGAVMRDLKPVWLMSPLSVSDTLPLDSDHFDVVIFDEASQIPVEEAVPALYRAQQVIVVGDEMQMPPSSFFGSKSDEELLLVEDEGEVIEYDMSANSFLNQAAKRMPSTLLGWHYRSRSEALILFSNNAFYGGRLLVVPEEQLPRTGLAEILVSAQEEDRDPAAAVEAILDRAVSFHFLERGIYEKRRNSSEADYIAQTVAVFLAKETGLSLGVVAFSEAQQGEIEQALERLARRDEEFRARYEAETEREENGEFVGLLIKNLENIQGDERDVVILSVCYGPDDAGKVRMNFGPINQAGGEKRLNVAFSRSKHHMVVVSSMRYHQITNVYNEGANCLRNYLRFAEASSVENTAVVRQVLGEMVASREDEAAAALRLNPVAEQLTAELARRGYRVDREVGESVFRCDLAVSREGDRIYRLGILIDDVDHYRQSDVLERDLMKPRLLTAFGWSVMAVLSKDWYEDQSGVLKQVLERLEATPEADSQKDNSQKDDTEESDVAD
jgi:hypothetical protein